jgi:hypothetical protein
MDGATAAAGALASPAAPVAPGDVRALLRRIDASHEAVGAVLDTAGAELARAWRAASGATLTAARRAVLHILQAERAALAIWAEGRPMMDDVADADALGTAARARRARRSATPPAAPASGSPATPPAPADAEAWEIALLERARARLLDALRG